MPPSWKMTGVNDFSAPPTGVFHAAFVDLHLTGKIERTEGLSVMKTLTKSFPNLEIVAISGNLDRGLMEDCLKAGASRFLAKPLSTEEIQLVLGKIEAWHQLQWATHRGSGSASWIGESPASQEVRKQIASLRGETGPILIEGESGCGKEVAAQLIHYQEPQRPFVQLNAAAIPENLFESELFGHVRGAFTGADSNKVGLAEVAHGGDLFLDEIEALPLTLQPKLLRFLETGEVRRVGAKESMLVQTRVIAATNRNLEEMVRKGTFREDLLWRLNGKKINLPPLRSRPQDIRALGEHFLQMERPKRNKSLGDDALKTLQEYQWPGNVRELRRVIEQLSLTSPLPIIRASDVMSVIRPIRTISDESVDLSRGLGPLVGDYERRLIIQAFKAKKDIDDAAKLLDISRSSFYKKLKDYNIDLEGLEK